MKLLRLKVNTGFRSLKAGFEINFREISDTEDMQSFQPFCFAGLNGSGKSNVLEMLANIFYHLDLCANRFKPEVFKKFFNPATNINGPDSFELEYLIFQKDLKDILDGYNIIRIIKKDEEPPIMYSRYVLESEETKEEIIPIVATSFEEAAPGKSFLPDLVVGYSSGENETLSIPFIKSRLIHFDEYAQSAVRDEKFTKPESNLVYIDSEMSQAVLLACLIFEDEDTLTPLRKELKIKSLLSFRMHLNDHILKVYDHKDKLQEFPILKHIGDKIKVLKQIATSWFEEKRDENISDGNGVIGPDSVLTLDFFIDEKMKKALSDVFSSAQEMFQFFQLLYELNNNFLGIANTDSEVRREVYQSAGFYTDGKLPLPGPRDKVFYFLDFLILKQDKDEDEPTELLLRQFSDGEHQFLHTLGICLLFKDLRTLMLLDEPETHFNPDWRSQFIRILKSSLEKGGSDHLVRDILITTHSPFIISSSFKKNVKFFKKVDNVVEVKEPDFNTFGTSIQIILRKMFKRKDIPELPLDIIEKLEEKLENGDRDFKSIINELDILGDSIQKRLLENYIIQLQNEKE